MAGKYFTAANLSRVSRVSLSDVNTPTGLLKSGTIRNANDAISYLSLHKMRAQTVRFFSLSKPTSSDKSDKHVPFKMNSNKQEIETHGQPLHSFGSSDKRKEASNRFDVQSQDGNPASGTGDYQPDKKSAHHADVYNHTPSVNLSACMQSQVPEPYGKSPSHMNMPGGVNRREVGILDMLCLVYIYILLSTVLHGLILPPPWFLWEIQIKTSTG